MTSTTWKAKPAGGGIGYSMSSFTLACTGRVYARALTYIADLEHPFGLESHILALELLTDLQHGFLKERIFLRFRRGFVGPQPSDEVLQSPLEHA